MAIQLLLLVLATSLLSGVLGMGGGMILMGALSIYLPAKTAIVVHGIIQFHSNGFRALLNKRHIKWKILPYYILGNLLGFAILQYLIFSPSKKIMFLLIGIMPFIAFLLRSKLQFNILNNWSSFSCGLIISLLKIIAGTSGPILDLFFLGSSLNRHEIIATKAITQTSSHFFKVVFYINVFFEGHQTYYLSKYFLSLAIISSLVGTKLGKYILDTIKESQFRKLSQIILFTIGTIYLLKGMTL